MPNEILSPLGGMTMGTGPNASKKSLPVGPPIVLPLVSIGNLAQAQKGTCSKKAKELTQPLMLKDSELTQTTGDQPSDLFGVVSGVSGNTAKVQNGAMKAKSGGRPLATVNSIIAHNGANANVPAGKALVRPPTKVTAL